MGQPDQLKLSSMQALQPEVPQLQETVAPRQSWLLCRALSSGSQAPVPDSLGTAPHHPETVPAQLEAVPQQLERLAVAPIRAGHSS